MKRLPNLTAVLLLAATGSLAPAYAALVTDGPYLSATPDPKQWTARWIDGDETALRVRSKTVKVASDVRVASVGALPAFKVRLRAPDRIAPDEVRLGADPSIFVVADTHGQFEILVELLQNHRIIDRSLRWSFGKGHLAILGDVFDRGPNQTEILWLIYKLEGEAAGAGGGVHFVLGNHEILSLLGDRLDLNPKYPKVIDALEAESQAALWSEDTFLGRWLRTKASVLKLGDYLCLHGGISRALVDRKLSLTQINDSVRDVLNNTDPYRGADLKVRAASLTLLNRLAGATDAPRELAGFLAMNKLGPLWYRGYFPEAALQGGFPVAADADVDFSREYFGVKAILVGHTIVPTVTSLYEGKVIAVQVYPHLDEQSGAAVMEGLRIEKGQFLRARIDGTSEALP